MLYINNPYTDAWFNLAAEEYLLKNFSDDIFMLWQNEPSVIIGKHQNVWDEINRNYIQESISKSYAVIPVAEPSITIPAT